MTYNVMAKSKSSIKTKCVTRFKNSCSMMLIYQNLLFLSEASQWERQATIHWRGREAEEAAQERLPRLQIPTETPQKRKARLRVRKWGRWPFGGWGQPQPIPLQGPPPGRGPLWGSRVPSGWWAPPSCCRWAAGSLLLKPLRYHHCHSVRVICQGQHTD